MGKNREKAEEYVRRYHLDKIGTHAPQVFLDLHVGGELAALQGYEDTETAAVFDLASGHILWLPKAVPALCWLPNSGDILLVRYQYQHDLELHRGEIRILTPLQSEFLYFVECWAWPEKRRISGCELHFPTGWPTYIAVSPRGDLAVVHWLEQDDSGIELFALTDAGPSPLPQGSYRAGTYLSDYAHFSPDGLYLILVCTIPFWWQPNEEDERLISPGGRFQVGEVVCMNTESWKYYKLPIYGELPKGWMPDDKQSVPEGYMLYAADFPDLAHLSVSMSNGYTWNVDLPP